MASAFGFVELERLKNQLAAIQQTHLSTLNYYVSDLENGYWHNSGIFPRSRYEKAPALRQTRHAVPVQRSDTGGGMCDGNPQADAGSDDPQADLCRAQPG